MVDLDIKLTSLVKTCKWHLIMKIELRRFKVISEMKIYQKVLLVVPFIVVSRKLLDFS